MKTSVSPVSVFLREEVCAVSDHLASVSLFDSDEWMNCLTQFSGWTDTAPAAEERIRTLVGKLHLRPLTEPGDVDSPLLRSQIDEQYLRAMASARAQMAGAGSQEERRIRTPKESSSRHSESSQSKSKLNSAGKQLHQAQEVSLFTIFHCFYWFVSNLALRFSITGSSTSVSSSKSLAFFQTESKCNISTRTAAATLGLPRPTWRAVVGRWLESTCALSLQC